MHINNASVVILKLSCSWSTFVCRSWTKLKSKHSCRGFGTLCTSGTRNMWKCTSTQNADCTFHKLVLGVIGLKYCYIRHCDLFLELSVLLTYYYFHCFTARSADHTKTTL